MKYLAALLLTAFGTCGALACGNADIVAPEPLQVVDTSPGSGALVPPGATPVVVIFNQAIDPTSLVGGVALKETTVAGLAIDDVDLSLDHYDPATFTAVFAPNPLGPDKYFALILKKGGVRAATGAAFTTDFTRAFRTAP